MGAHTAPFFIEERENIEVLSLLALLSLLLASIYDCLTAYGTCLSWDYYSMFEVGKVINWQGFF